jgi:hypothetical protein
MLAEVWPGLEVNFQREKINLTKRMSSQMTIVFAAVVAAILGGALWALPRRSIKIGLRVGVKLLLVLVPLHGFIAYFALPAFIGSLGGYWWIIALDALLLAAAGICTCMVNKSDFGSGAREEARFKSGLWLAGGSAGVLVLVLLNSWCLGIYNHAGLRNKVYYSNFLKVRNADRNDQIPRSDTRNIAWVTKENAVKKMKQALNARPDLSTLVQINESEAVTTWIDGQLVWVAPLEYQKFLTQFGVFGYQHMPNSPGYAQVKMTDVGATGELKVGPEYEMSYFPSASFRRNIFRHIYMSGYDHGIIDDLTLDPMDNGGHPSFVATYNQYDAVVDGEVIKKVLIVDAQSGEISPYDPDKVPSWVDRVLSHRLQRRYVDDYLRYGWLPNSLKNFSTLWGANGLQFKVLDEQEVYDDISGHPRRTYLVTSNDDTNDAAIGVLSCSTAANDCIRFDGLKPPSKKNAESAIKALCNPNNVAGIFVDNLQLYQIESTLTWTGVCERREKGSDGIEQVNVVGFDLVEAANGKTQGLNAVHDSNLLRALRKYSDKLQHPDTESLDRGDKTRPVVEVKGSIYKIAHLVSSGDEILVVTVKTADGKVLPLYFVLNPTLNFKYAFLVEGAEVKIRYEAIKGNEQRFVERVESPALADLPDVARESVEQQPE